MSATALAANEASGQGFPLTPGESWTLAFVVIIAFLTSLSNEASKRHEGDTFVPSRFWGNVGLGLAAGICIPLLTTVALEHFFQVKVDWRASIGLSILGAYMGREALGAAWTGLKSLGELAGKLKGIRIRFDPPKPDAEPDDPKGGGGDA